MGDPKQLPATVLAQYDGGNVDFSRSMMERLSMHATRLHNGNVLRQITHGLFHEATLRNLSSVAYEEI